MVLYLQSNLGHAKRRAEWNKGVLGVRAPYVMTWRSNLCLLHPDTKAASSELAIGIKFCFII